MSWIVRAGYVERGVGKLGSVLGERLELGMLKDLCRVVVRPVFGGRDGCSSYGHCCG